MAPQFTSAVGALPHDGRWLVVGGGDWKTSDPFLAPLQALLAKHRTAAPGWSAPPSRRTAATTP